MTIERVNLMKSKLLIAIGLTSSLLLASCNNASKDESSAVVQMDGQVITEAEFFQTLKDRNGSAILEELVQQKILTAEAEKLGITDEEVKEELETIKSSFGIESDDELLSFLQSQLPIKTIDEFKTNFIKPNIALQKLAAEGVEVTDEDLKTYFNENYMEVKASHILVDTEEEAKKLYEQVKAGGDFAAIAKEHSQDPGSAENGGDLGFFGKGQMLKEFEEVAFAQEPGEISEPIQSSRGYHIIKTVEKKLPDFEEMKEEARKRYIEEHSRPINEVMDELYKKAKVEVKDEQFKDLFKAE